MPLQVLLETATAKMPAKAHATDTGWDVFVDHEVTVTEVAHAIDVGIRLAIPSGYWVQLAEKSGKALSGLEIHGGIIDQDYRGRVKVIAKVAHGAPSMVIPQGKAICQMILHRLEPMSLEEIGPIEYTCGETERGEGGFGSSGQ